jgi:hypothetical protein
VAEEAERRAADGDPLAGDDLDVVRVEAIVRVGQVAAREAAVGRHDEVALLLHVELAGRGIERLERIGAGEEAGVEARADIAARDGVFRVELDLQRVLVHRHGLALDADVPAEGDEVAVVVQDDGVRRHADRLVTRLAAFRDGLVDDHLDVALAIEDPVLVTGVIHVDDVHARGFGEARLRLPGPGLLGRGLRSGRWRRGRRRVVRPAEAGARGPGDEERDQAGVNACHRAPGRGPQRPAGAGVSRDGGGATCLRQAGESRPYIGSGGGPPVRHRPV